MHVSTSAWNLKCLLRFHQWVDLKKTPSPQLARLPFRVRFRPYAIRSSMRYKNPPRFWRFNGCGDGSVFHPSKPHWIAVGYVGYVFYAFRICIAFRVPLYCGGSFAFFFAWFSEEHVFGQNGEMFYHFLFITLSLFPAVYSSLIDHHLPSM